MIVPIYITTMRMSYATFDNVCPRVQNPVTYADRIIECIGKDSALMYAVRQIEHGNRAHAGGRKH